jgi:hypothetical protein
MESNIGIGVGGETVKDRRGRSVQRLSFSNLVLPHPVVILSNAPRKTNELELSRVNTVSWWSVVTVVTVVVLVMSCTSLLDVIDWGVVLDKLCLFTLSRIPVRIGDDPRSGVNN